MDGAGGGEGDLEVGEAVEVGEGWVGAGASGLEALDGDGFPAFLGGMRRAKERTMLR